MKIELSLRKRIYSGLLILSFEEKSENLAFSPKMLGKGRFGNLVTS